MTVRLLRSLVAMTTVLAGVALVAAVVATVVVPRAMGWTPLTILSGSMEPTIPVGSQVVVDPVEDADDVASLRVGDVVTFMPWPDDPTLVTHRVVTRSVDAAGTVTVTTQGDANDAPDGLDLTQRELRAVVRYHVPFAGYVAQMLDRGQKTVGVAALAGGLGAYAAVQTVLAARDHRRSSRTARVPAGAVTIQEPAR